MWLLRPRPQSTRKLFDVCNMDHTAALVLAIAFVALPVAQGLEIEVRNFYKRAPQASLPVASVPGGGVCLESTNYLINKYTDKTHRKIFNMPLGHDVSTMS